MSLATQVTRTHSLYWSFQIPTFARPWMGPSRSLGKFAHAEQDLISVFPKHRYRQLTSASGDGKHKKEKSKERKLSLGQPKAPEYAQTRNSLGWMTDSFLRILIIFGALEIISPSTPASLVISTWMTSPVGIPEVGAFPRTSVDSRDLRGMKCPSLPRSIVRRPVTMASAIINSSRVGDVGRCWGG